MTVATISLAIIAATCVIAVGAFVWFIVRLWRVVSRVEAILTLVHRAVPGFLDDVQGMLTKVDREILGDIVRMLKRMTAVGVSAIETVAQVQEAARRVAQGVLFPPMAAATGLFAVIREGLTWFRSEGDGRSGVRRSRRSRHAHDSGPGDTWEAGPDERTDMQGRDE